MIGQVPRAEKPEVEHFTTEGFLANGHSHDVWMARSDVERRSQYVIKLYAPSEVGEEQGKVSGLTHRAAFRRMNQHGNTKSHTNVAYNFPAQTRDGRLCVVEEYVPDSAQEWREQNDAVLGAEVPRVAFELADGLEFIHNTIKTRYGDFSPDNIRFNEGTPKYIDHSAATRLGSDPRTNVGNELFRAPETFEHPSTNRSDIFSWAVMVYWLQTGETPLQHEMAERSSLEDRIALMKDPSSERIMRKRIRQAGFPRSLHHTLLRAARWEPDMRYEDVTELKKSLLKPTISTSLEASLLVFACLLGTVGAHYKLTNPSDKVETAQSVVATQESNEEAENVTLSWDFGHVYVQSPLVFRDEHTPFLQYVDNNPLAAQLLSAYEHALRDVFGEDHAFSQKFATTPVELLENSYSIIGYINLAQLRQYCRISDCGGTLDESNLDDARQVVGSAAVKALSRTWLERRHNSGVPARGEPSSVWQLQGEDVILEMVAGTHGAERVRTHAFPVAPETILLQYIHAHDGNEFLLPPRTVDVIVRTAHHLGMDTSNLPQLTCQYRARTNLHYPEELSYMRGEDCLRAL